MSEENQERQEQQAPPPARAGAASHAPAANPEQHLLETHNLSIKVQGKEGQRSFATWALVKTERGKERTLAVYEGYHRQAIVHFYDYIHPDKGVLSVPERPSRRAPSGPPRRSTGGPPRRSGGGGPPGRGGGGSGPPRGGGGGGAGGGRPPR
jgi:uncharacterized membrane protein YgcG